MNYLAFLESADIEKVKPFFTEKRLAQGETLFQEGEPGDFMAFIISGKMKNEKDTEFPDKRLVLAVHGPGSFLGELAVTSGAKRSTTVVALEECKLAILTKNNFEKIIEKFPEIAVKFLKVFTKAVAIRLRQADARIASVF